MRLLSSLALSLLLGGCGIVYRLPTRQGNVVEQTKVDQLQLGQTRTQVQYLMGTPIATSPYVTDRWDYLGYYRTPRGQVYKRLVSLYFVDDKVTKMEGTALAAGDSRIETPDARVLTEQEVKDHNDASRAKSEQGKQTGVKIPTP